MSKQLTKYPIKVLIIIRYTLRPSMLSKLSPYIYVTNLIIIITHIIYTVVCIVR